MNLLFKLKNLLSIKKIAGIIKAIKLNLLPKHNAKNKIEISNLLIVRVYNPKEYNMKDQE